MGRQMVMVPWCQGGPGGAMVVFMGGGLVTYRWKGLDPCYPPTVTFSLYSLIFSLQGAFFLKIFKFCSHPLESYIILLVMAHPSHIHTHPSFISSFGRLRAQILALSRFFLSLSHYSATSYSLKLCILLSVSPRTRPPGLTHLTIFPSRQEQRDSCVG